MPRGAGRDGVSNGLDAAVAEGRLQALEAAVRAAIVRLGGPGEVKSEHLIGELGIWIGTAAAWRPGSREYAGDGGGESSLPSGARE